MTEQRREGRTDRYSVRGYEPGDREAFLTLYADVFGKERDATWFDWRYDGPYVSQVAMTVAERAGELVGALPFIGFRLRAGGDTVLALQP
ncbi:GNAT family N-acetyltransferase, partial [Halobium palmae]